MTITEVDKQPVLRFSESEEPWDEHPLEALAAQPISYGVVQTGEHIEGGIPCVRVVDLTSDAVDPNAMLRTSDAISNSYRRTVLEKDDIMMALRGEIGLVRSVPDELVGANLTRGVARIVAQKKLVDPHFLLWSLQSPAVITEIGQKVNGSALKEIPIGGLREVVLSIPRSKTEQQKIAAFLGAVDRKIQQLKRKQELLERYKKGVVQQLFSQELRFKREDGSEYPEWEEIAFGDIYTFYGTNSLSRDKLNYDGGDVLNIHYGDIHTKFAAIFNAEQESVPFINEDVDLSRTPEEQYCRPGDLVIADASEDLSDIGKTIEVVSTGGKKIVAGLHTYLARPKRNTMAPGYGAYLMRSEQVREEIERLAHGTKVMSISRTHLNSIVVSLPSLEEQSRIAGFLMALDAKVAGVAQAVAAAEKWKKGLLQQMFV